MTDNQKIFLVTAIAITGVGIIAYHSGRKSAPKGSTIVKLTGDKKTMALLTQPIMKYKEPTERTPQIKSGQGVMTNDEWISLLNTNNKKSPSIIAHYNLLADNYIQGNPTLQSNWKRYASTGKVTAGVNDYKMILFALNNGFTLPI